MAQTSAARRVVYVLASLLPVWALVAYFTGGVGWMLGPLRISSRQPLRPLVVGLLCAAWYVWKYPPAERAVDGSWLLHLFGKAVPVAVPALVALAMYIGVHYGSFAVAGSDSYGYVSEARLWLTGNLRVAQPWVEQFSWPNREWMFSPLGYRPVAPVGTIVPTYPAGLPIVMALFMAIFGDNGPFLVVPLFGAVLVWLTYVFGTHATGSGGAGALAALFLIASPVFLAHVMVPMSDIPAAAGWTLVCVLVLKQRSLAAGWAAGLSLLIRPNLFPLVLLPVMAWHSSQDRLLSYAKGLAPSLIGIMALNAYLYEGPLTFGYGSIFESYALSSAPLNVVNYVRWLLETQTPLILLAFVPLAVRGALREDNTGFSARACLAAIVGLTFLSYVFYANFDHWFYLRFMMPAYPALFVLLSASIFWIVQKLPMEGRVPVAMLASLTIVLAGVNLAQSAGVFDVASFERRYVRAAAEVASRTPENAIVLAVQHSGSVRYYANRVTLRFDWLAPDQLDAAIRDLKAKGYHPYLVVDDWEQKEFQSRFGRSNRMGRLDWEPLARVSETSGTEVRLFQMQDGGPAPQQ